MMYGSFNILNVQMKLVQIILLFNLAQIILLFNLAQIILLFNLAQSRPLSVPFLFRTSGFSQSSWLD